MFLCQLPFTLYSSPTAATVCRINNMSMTHYSSSHSHWILAILITLSSRGLDEWFWFNCFPLNADKSEFILFSTVQLSHISNLVCHERNVANACVHAMSDIIKTLGTTLDSHLTFNSHKFRLLLPFQSLPPHPFVSRSWDYQIISVIHRQLKCWLHTLYGVSESNMVFTRSVRPCKHHIICHCSYHSSILS